MRRWGAGTSVLDFMTSQGLSEKTIICFETETRSQLFKELRKDNSRQKKTQNESGTLKELAHTYFCSTMPDNGIMMFNKSHEAPGLKDWLATPTADDSTWPGV